MNSDAHPPQAGQENGVRAPAEKNTNAAAPAGAAADPYAGLSNFELRKRLSERDEARRKAQERAQLIRALESDPEPPDPLKDLTAMSRRLREKIPERPGNDEIALTADVAALRSMYADLLHNADGRAMDDRTAMTFALRAQKQAFDIFAVLKKLELLESAQNPPEKK